MSPQAAAARLPDSASDLGVKHIWVTAGHSLCELEDGGIEQDTAELASGFAAVCGPCLLIVGRLRRQAAAFLDLADGRVAPERPSESWRLLDKSPWGRRLNIRAFLAGTPEVDTQTRYEAICYEVDPASVRELVTEIHDLFA